MNGWMRMGMVVALSGLLLGLVLPALAARYNIVLEAEHYSTIKPSAAAKSGDAQASKMKYTEYPVRRPHAQAENAAVKGDGGYVLFKVRVPEAGTWKVWLRTWWYDGCGNSFFVVVDDKPPQTVGGDGTYKVWKWRDAKQTYSLTAGVHTIKVQNREDGARLDQILLTNDLRPTPTRIMTETLQYKVTE